MALVAVSCSSDDDQDSKTINLADAVGTWMCTESSDTSYGRTYTGLLVGAQITINANGTYTSTASSFGESGTFTINGQNITAINSNGDTFIVTASINGDRMKWSGTASTGVQFDYVFIRESR